MPAPKAITVTHRTEADNEVFSFLCLTPGDHTFTMSRAEQNPDGTRTLAEMTSTAYAAIQAAIEAKVGELDSALGPAGATFVPATDTTPAVLTPLAAPPPTVDVLAQQLADTTAKIDTTQAQVVAAIAAVDQALADQVNALIEAAKQGTTASAAQDAGTAVAANA